MVGGGGGTGAGFGGNIDDGAEYSGGDHGVCGGGAGGVRVMVKMELVMVVYMCRWGRVRTIETLRGVVEGEELLVDYGYDLIRWRHAIGQTDYTPWHFCSLTGSWTGDWRLVTGDWRLETGDWRLETGYRSLETRD